MKHITTKIPAFLGMLISLFSFALIIGALILSINPALSDEKPFALWVFSVIIAMFGLIFYVADAILSIIKAIKRINPIFNIVLAVIIFGSIPMVVYVGGGLGINILIWNLYHLALFILEIISILLHIRKNTPANQ